MVIGHLCNSQSDHILALTRPAGFVPSAAGGFTRLRRKTRACELWRTLISALKYKTCERRESLQNIADVYFNVELGHSRVYRIANTYIYIYMYIRMHSNKLLCLSYSRQHLVFGARFRLGEAWRILLVLSLPLSMCIYIYICMCICVYIYIYIYIHTYLPNSAGAEVERTRMCGDTWLCAAGYLHRIASGNLPLHRDIVGPYF